MTNNDAVEILSKDLGKYVLTEHDEAILMAIKALEVCPNCKSRPQGKWAFDEKGNFYCDQCGKYPHDQYATTNFCPNCGAIINYQS